MIDHLTDTNVGNIEYIRREDAKDALQEKVFHNLTDEFYGAMQAIDELSSADVVPVVRCRDCKHWQTDWNPSIPDRHYCAVMDSMMKADDFCSYGERKE